MAYFPHAFQKLLIATNGFYKTGAANFGAGKTSIDLLAGQVGVVNGSTHALYDLTVTPVAAVAPVYLAQGSFHTVDKIGPFHGGYKESIKTKGINARYVGRFYKQTPDTAQNQIVKVGCSAVQTLECNKTYRLRLDIKGSPALRFLSHNLYNTFDAFSGCCPLDPTADQTIDPAVIFEAWSAQINAMPLFKDFVVASVEYLLLTGGSWVSSGTTKPGTWASVANNAKACKLILTGAYQDTTFGNCSFDPKDFVEMEPVMIYPSVVDDLGDPCNTLAFCVAETQAPRVANGLGENILRDLILQKRYLQEPWQQDPRKREVEDITTMSDISRATLYTSYYILHNVPRNSNSSGMLDADQYLIRIVVSAADVNFETWFNAFLSTANTTVALETV
jgi:hypothetical protein